MVGKLSVSNSCGVLGKTYTNPTPVAVPAITTASYHTWPSTCRPQGNDVDVVIDTLHQEDIACPTWGLSDPFTTTCDGDVYLTATEGYPYNPVILVPTQFLGYDPAWGACSAVPENGLFVLPCGLYDPPRALHAATAMTPVSDPPVTQAPAQPEVAASPAVVPATTPPIQAPQTTKAPAPLPVQPVASTDPSQNQGSSNSNQGSGSQGNDPPSGSTGQGSGNSNSSPAASSNQDPGQQQGSSNSDPQAVPNQDPPQNQGNSNNAPAPASNQSPAANNGAQGSNGQPTNANNGAQGSGNRPANSNQQPAANNGAQGSGNQPANSNQPAAANNGAEGSGNQPAGSPATNPQIAAPAPQPIAQTTINIGGSQPSPSLGSIINNALGASPAPVGQQNSGSTGQQGSSSESNPGTNPGTAPGGVPGANSGSGTEGNQGSNPEGSSVGASGSNSGESQGGNPSVSSGGTQSGGNEGAAGGSGESSGGNPVGSSPGSSPGVESNPGSGGNSGSGGNADQGGSQSGQSGNQGGNAQPNANNAAFTPHAINVLGQTLSAVDPSAVAIAGKTLSAGGPAFTSNGNFYSVGPSGNLVAGTLAPGATPAPVLTFGGSTYTANSASQFVVAGQTLAPGAQITVSGTPIALPAGSSNIAVIGSSTQSLSMITPAPGQAHAVMTFGGSTYSANAASQFVIGGQTLSPGAQITVSGTPIALPAGSSNIAVIGSSTQSLSMITPAPGQGPALLTFGGSTYTANAASQFVVGGQTLNPGSQITVSGTAISLAPSGAASAFAVIGTSTQALGNAAASAVQSPALLTFDGTTYTANSASQFVIAGKTLTPGGTVNVFGVPISEAAGGSFAVIGTSTQSLSTPGPTQGPALLTFNGQTYTANSASDFVIGSQTLTPGGQITVSGTPIAEAPSGSGLVAVGSSTQVLGHAQAGVTSAAVMTFNGQMYTADSASDFVIGNQTLTPGGMITVSGTPISEAAGATDVVIGTSTEALSSVAVTSAPMAFEGAGSRVGLPNSIWLLGWMGVAFLSGLLFLT